ncbi:unnamed protein product [Microthlaspi erraticum]|uniref:F-box domain-containing protein n=1 Tax=Microthlaspi erraticum TaxID=1685480 RepID=A0A6D2JV67_9BRAS|nr:unnamed protein product [Microthlaspi erraticum]
MVDCILEKLPIKSLLRFKSVSKQWKSTIESPYFKKRHLISRQSQDPDVLITNPLESELSYDEWKRQEYPNTRIVHENVMRIFTMGSSELIKLPNIGPPLKPVYLNNSPDDPAYSVIQYSVCDGMISYYNEYSCIYVVNPITGWCRKIPQARYQAFALDVYNRDGGKGEEGFSFWLLGFGKDKFTDTYKLVWLYNSLELGLKNSTTTCEVFDFSTNTWSYVTAAPRRVIDFQIPVYLDGSLHWFTDEPTGENPRVLSFDLATETFHIISKAPFVNKTHNKIIMCGLDNQLCVSQKEWPRQEIWSLNNSDMTWEKMFSLDLQTDSHLFAENFQFGGFIPHTIMSVLPVAVLKKTKALVLYEARAPNPNLTIYDPESGSYDICFPRDYRVWHQAIALPFFPSMISIDN